MKIWFAKYWPWLVAFFWLVGYELGALMFHYHTLSQLVWMAPHFVMWIALPIIIVLVIHFWIKHKIF